MERSILAYAAFLNLSQTHNSQVEAMCKELNVDVYFEEQNIHTMSEDGKLMLTILASFAQAESLSVAVLFLHLNFCSAVEDEYQVSVFSYLDGVDSLMKGKKILAIQDFLLLRQIIFLRRHLIKSLM